MMESMYVKDYVNGGKRQERRERRETTGTVLVCVASASANRDESVFTDADVFDIARTPNRHITFGLGIHCCLGAPLARMEGKIAFDALLSRFPDLKLALPVEQLQWRGGPALRGCVACLFVSTCNRKRFLLRGALSQVQAWTGITGSMK